MVNTNNPAELIQSLGTFQGNAAAESLSFRILNPEEVKPHAIKMKAQRYWGVLPFAVSAANQTIALYPFAGRPISEWPVLLAYPEAEGFRTIASGISKFVSCFTLGNMSYSESPEDYLEALPFLESAAAFFGDENFGNVKQGIGRKKITKS